MFKATIIYNSYKMHTICKNVRTRKLNFSGDECEIILDSCTLRRLNPGNYITVHVKVFNTVTYDEVATYALEGSVISSSGPEHISFKVSEVY